MIDHYLAYKIDGNKKEGGQNRGNDADLAPKGMEPEGVTDEIDWKFIN
ncbi:MAG: hypothetical protein HS126_34380 [Anaerolineales bacterium]|nr:hypothetical protein [Anaerolineales bacterium]